MPKTCIEARELVRIARNLNLLSPLISRLISNMNEARKTSRISDSKPASVLSRISAAQGHVVEHPGDRETTYVEATLSRPANVEAIDVPIAEPVAEKSFIETIRLRINPETHPEFDNQESVEGFLDSCIESAEQVQQLAQRLGENEDQLRARESDLEKRIAAWDRRVESLESEIDHKLNQLQQQASQARCLQLNLMQLQTDIVKSHEATKEAIESLVVDSSGDAQTVATLKALKYQISGRFDYIARRWEHLSGLLQAQRDADVAERNVDDSVDWAGELA